MIVVKVVEVLLIAIVNYTKVKAVAVGVCRQCIKRRYNTIQYNTILQLPVDCRRLHADSILPQCPCCVYAVTIRICLIPVSSAC